MAAPVPAPSIPVLTARHPGVTPQPASARDETARISEISPRAMYVTPPHGLSPAAHNDDRPAKIPPAHRRRGSLEIAQNAAYWAGVINAEVETCAGYPVRDAHRNSNSRRLRPGSATHPNRRLARDGREVRPIPNARSGRDAELRRGAVSGRDHGPLPASPVHLRAVRARNTLV
jgi:hypothetical protein